MRFWDSSALIALALRQTGSEALVPLAISGDGVGVWWGTHVEVVSGITRVLRMGEIDEARASNAIGHMEDVLATAQEVAPTESIRLIAIRAVRLHGLTAADALQLAAALVWTDHNPPGVGFVCLDQRLCEAARREGFDILPK